MSAPYDTILTIDFETYWDTKEGYTLTKMTTEEYIRHDKFRAYGACVHVYGSDEPTRWVSAEGLREYFNGVDWGRTAVLAHNAQFDVSIMEWVYAVHPAFIFDTLSMARALRGVEVGNSLAKLAGDFGLSPKGTAVYSTNGLVELTDKLEEELADYCAHDVFLCEQIFGRLVRGYPSKELRLIDMTLKMYTRACLQLDPNMLTDAILDEKEKREALLQKLGVEETALASNPQFAALLEKLNVVPPTKTSKTTGKQTLALAKNDALFQTLLNSEREDVALLCEARLRVKSTTERTRAQRFLDISQRGALPVPLSYYGAQTGRWTASKGSAINMQNLKRGSFLRKAIMTPEGHQLVVGDLSQIEPRVLAWLSDYTDMLDIFRAGGDPYAAFGAQMFNIPNLSKESHPDLRQSAKSALLGCGYGLGWAAFASQLLTGFLGAPPQRYDLGFAKKLGVTQAMAEKFLDWEVNVEKLRAIPHTCTTKELVIHCLASKAIIDKYRATATPVVDFWSLNTELIHASLYKGKEYKHKCLTYRKGEIELPSGMKLLYPDLNVRRYTDEKTNKEQVEWTYGQDRTKIYAGKITNNVTQGVARCVMTDGMVRTAKRYFVAGTVHDEQIVVLPDAEVSEAKAWVLAQMTMEPPYMQGIPLDADGGAHRRYGLAKS